jgi:predicted phosphodiesterase
VRYLILSDIHANIDAFEAVLAAAPPGTWDRAIVLGDLVGYGAEPNAVVDRVRALSPLAVIRGNHDKAACGIEDGSSFNTVARMAALWTLQTLTPDNREYLRALPQGPLTIDDTVEICHGAPFDEDHYIFDGDDAGRALDATERPVCLFGHTHLPVVFRRNADVFDGFVPEASDTVPLTMDASLSYLVNVGSVGQPRDGDPRASAMVIDGEAQTMEWHRVEYPIDRVQRLMSDLGLPRRLISRLQYGL